MKLAAYLIEEKDGRPLMGIDCPLGFVRQVGDPADRIIEFVGSTADIDRYQEIIEVEGWDLKFFKMNPVFLFGHNYRDPSIGQAVKVWKDLAEEDKKALRFHIKFASHDVYPFADQIYKLYQGGFMRTTSVGFIPIEWMDTPSEEMKASREAKKKMPWRTHKKQELLELSAVPVPANPHALMNAFQSQLIHEETLNRLKALGAEVEREVIDLSHYKAFDVEQVPALIEATFNIKLDETKSIEEGAPAAPVTEPAPVEAPAPSKILVIDSISLTSRGLRLLAVTPEILESIAQKDGAVIQWNDGSESIREIVRTAASELDPEGRVGAVLNKKNKDRIKQIASLATEVLAEAEPAEEDDEPAEEGCPGGKKPKKEGEGATAEIPSPVSPPVPEHTNEHTAANPPEKDHGGAGAEDRAVSAPADSPEDMIVLNDNPPPTEEGLIIELSTPDAPSPTPKDVEIVESGDDTIVLDVPDSPAENASVVAPAPTQAPPSPEGQEGLRFVVDTDDLTDAVSAGIQHALGKSLGSARASFPGRIIRRRK